MKEILKRITIICVLIILLVNSSLLIIISNAVDAIENILNKTNINLLHEIKIEKYVNYNIEDFKGTLAQFNLKTEMEYEKEENYKPSSSTGILLNLPKIESEYPESVEVIEKSTQTTNGQSTAENFDFVYNKDIGELKIAVVNKGNEDGNIYNEYSIICYYSSNCYDSEKTNRNLELSGLIQVNIENESKTSDIIENFEVSENISGVISTNVEVIDIYDGYINSNNKNGTNYKTEYLENLDIDISMKELSDEISIETSNCFINSEENVIHTRDIIYKSTKISKNNILNILGEDGFLQILNENGDILEIVNKDTEVQDDDICEVIYENELSTIIIKTSKPLRTGKIKIENTKEIKENVTDTEITKIKTIDNISCVKNNQLDTQDEEDKKIVQNEIYNFLSENIVEIKNATTRVELSMNNSNWTNNIQNAVQFNVKLVANSIKDKLFENPVIEIELPNEVEKVILSNTNLLYANGLNLENIEVIDGKANKIIKIKLSGMQNYYNTEMIDGAEIIIPTIIILKKDISTVETKIKLKCFNSEETTEIDKIVNIASISDSFANKIEQVSLFMNNENEKNEVDGLITDITATLGENVLEDNQEVHEYEYIRFNVKLKNNSSNKIENINIVGDVPEGMTYVKCYHGEYSGEENDWFRTEEDSAIKEYIETINLEPGEEKYLYYWTRVNTLEDEETEKIIENNVCIKVNEDVLEQKNIVYKAKKAQMTLKVNARETYTDDNIWMYDLVVTNNTDKPITNIVMNMDLLDYMKFQYANFHGYTVSETYNGVKIDVPVLEANESKPINLYIQLYEKENGERNFESQAYVSAYGDDTDVYYSNLNKENVYIPGIEIVQTSEKEGQELQYDEEVEFDFVIRNTSDRNVKRELLNPEIINYMDKNLVPLTVEYEQFEYNEETEEYIKSGIITKDISKKYVPDGVDESDVEDLYLWVVIPKGEEIHLKLKAKAGEVKERTETSNCIKIVYEYCGDNVITSNIIKNIILPREIEENPGDGDENQPGEDNPNNPGGDDSNKPGTDNPGDGDTNKPGEDNPNNPGEEKPDIPEEKYYISGFAWEDKNKNGKYDKDSEIKLQNITVKLFDAETNSIVKDENGNNLNILTDENGEYVFNNIKKGKYLVLFEYDNENYELTTYKQDIVSETENSDVINKNVSIDGIEKIVAITDIIEVSSDTGYINIGLIKKQRFDLALDKYISKVTIKYEGYNKTYEYSEAKLAKVEVPAKKIDGATIEVEYKINVKNEGDISGYVDEIVDYLPEGFEFSDELNKGWSKVGNNIIKNTENAGIVIKPEESKTVTLYLTRTLTADTIGTLTNYAEILKSSSINGDVDIDSVEGNRDEDEDDYSKAELIVSVKTGVGTFSWIIILLIIAMIILKVCIEKNIINFERIKIVSILLLFISVTVLTQFSYAEEPTSTINSLTTFSSASEEDPNLVIEKFDMNDAKAALEEIAINNAEGEGSQSFEDNSVHAPNCEKDDVVAPWTYRVKDKENEHYKTETVYKIYHYKEDGEETSKVISKSKYDEFEECTTPNHVGCYVSEEEDEVFCCYYYYYCWPANYIDHRKVSEAKVGDFYCSSGGSMALYPYSWSYTFSSLSGVTVTNPEEISRENVAKIEDSGSNPEYIPCDKNYYLVGPYSITYEGDLSGGPSYPTTDASGQEIEISSGTAFYLKVPKKDITIGGFKFSVSKKALITYSVSYSYTEKWITSEDPAGVPYSSSTNDSQIIGRKQAGSTEIEVECQTKTWIELPGAELPVGSLTIEKKDYDTGEFISGATVRVENAEWYFDETYTISGNLTINNLPADATYTVTEIETATGYLLELQDDIQKTGTVQVNSTITVTLENRQYGDLRIRKLDADTHNNNLAGYIFSGVTFEIFYSGPRESNSWTVTTDGNAEILLTNIPKVGKYTIREVSLPGWMNGYYDVKSSVDEVELKNNYDGTITDVSIYNKQVYVDLSGFVWEDEVGGKVSTRDDLYNKGENLIENIPVYLKINGNIIRKTKTDKNGKYYFSTVRISVLSQATIEFEYNGLKYENVKVSNKYNGSKAKETIRTTVNNNFKDIYGDENKNEGNTGLTGKNVKLDYTNGNNYTSKLVQNTEYTKDSLTGNITPIDSAKMLADTKTAGYTISWSAGTMEITNINFGIYEREQIDLAIATDIDNIELTINGDYNHIYKYNGREAVIDKGFDVSGKNLAEYRNVSYERPIYDSYIAYTEKDKTNSNKLRVYITYKIKVNGTADSLTLKNYADARLNFVSSYYDGGEKIQWSPVSSGIWKSNEIKSNSTIFLKYELSTEAIISLATLNEFEIDKNITEISSYSAGGRIDIDSAPDNIVYGDTNTYEDDTDAAPNIKFLRQESKVISGFVFEDKTDKELKTNEERKGSTKYENNEEKVENVQVQILSAENNQVIDLYNIKDGKTEITKAQYLTTQDGKFEFVGLIPGTYYIQYTYGNYEYINKNISGSTKQTKQTKIGNIDVTTESYKSTIVNQDRFKVLLDNNVENSSGYSNLKEDYSNNGSGALWYWYENTDNNLYSSAVDDYSIRLNINNNLSTINYDKKDKYDKLEDDKNLHYINANTGYIDFAIEDIRNQTTLKDYNGTSKYSVCFGIVERPRQSIETDKTISNIKVTLSNGQVLLEGDPRTDKLPYVTYPGSQILKIEVDNTIIEGSKLEVSYEMVILNKSEIDYDNIKYYRYGDSSGLTPVKIKLNSIVDYVDEKLSVTYDIGESGSQFVYYNKSDILDKWQLITEAETNKLTGIPISQAVYKSVKDRKNTVVRDTNIYLGPSEKVAIGLSAQKLLTNLIDNDQLFDNHMEIIEVYNSVGRFYGQMNSTKWKLNTPGNYDINNIANTSEADNNSYLRAHITIVPPTGIESIIVYLGIGVISLITLAGGIILIKKKVLN